jgi:hypothetical protein
MKNKIHFLIGFLFAFSCARAQEVKIIGKIIDQDSKEPLFGGYIVYKGNPTCFSGEKGCFELLLPHQVTSNDSITISHLAYQEKTIALADLKSDTNLIFVKEKIYQLNEVFVQPVKDKDVLKHARDRFRETYPLMPYWAEAYYKQLVSYKGEPRGYLECYGTMLQRGIKRKEAFQPYIIPSEVRRTKEDLIISVLLKDKNTRLQAGGSYIDLTQFDYHFFELCHPLSQHLRGEVEFHLDSICNINNTTCYLYSYKQKKMISCWGWHNHGVRGQIWIDKKNYTLLKVTCTFNRGDVTSNMVVIEYALQGNTIYPRHISISLVHNRYSTKIEPQKILVESEINFGKTHEASQPWDYFIECYLPHIKYDANFWAQYPINNSYMKTKVSELMGNNNWDQEFEKGSKEPIFEDSKHVDRLMKDNSDNAIKGMKKDLNLN